MVHMFGHAVGAYTDATHGMTLAAVTLPYYKFLLPYGLKRFKRFAESVSGVNAEGRDDTAVAQEGLEALKGWMTQLGLVMNTAELGMTEDMLDGVTDATLIMDGGYKVLDKKEIRQILAESMVDPK